METYQAAIRDEALRIYSTSMHSATIQLEASKIYRRRALVAGAISTITATVGGLGTLSTSSGWYSLLVFTAALTSFLTAVGDPFGKAKQSEICGHEYVRLRNDTRSFANVDLEMLGQREAKNALESLKVREALLNCQIAIAPNKARRIAKKELKDADPAKDILFTIAEGISPEADREQHSI